MIYEKLYQDILDEKIKPGVRLHERELAEKMGVSRTPIREALFLLEANGLVKRYPKLGIVVSELTLRDVIEAFQIREFIEPPATAIAAKVLGEREEELRKLQQELIELKAAKIEDSVRYKQHDIVDITIHDLIIEAVANSKLKSIMDMIRSTCNRARLVGTPVRFTESVNEHLELLQALIKGNPEQAEKSMKIHLINTRQRLVEYI